MVIYCNKKDVRSETRESSVPSGYLREWAEAGRVVTAFALGAGEGLVAPDPLTVERGWEGE